MPFALGRNFHDDISEIIQVGLGLPSIRIVEDVKGPHGKCRLQKPGHHISRWLEYREIDTGLDELFLNFILNSMRYHFAQWKEWAEEIANRCTAAAERYQLAAHQLSDCNVHLSLHTTLAPANSPLAVVPDPYEPAEMGELPADKECLRKFYAEFIAKQLMTMADNIRLHLNKQKDWVAISPKLWKPLDIEVSAPRSPAALFIEARVALMINRPGQEKRTQETSSLLQASTVVPPSFSRTFKQHQPPVEAFADAVIQNLLPGYRAALGAPAEAGRRGEALWFVADSLLPNAAEASGGDRPGYYALPPMRNAPASFTFENKDVWPRDGNAPEMRSKVNLSDVDADTYAKKALQMVEDLLDPRTIKLLMSTVSGQAVVDAAVHVSRRAARQDGTPCVQ
jgi:hypothetical protein